MRRTSLGLLLSAALHVAGAAAVALMWPAAPRVAAAELSGAGPTAGTAGPMAPAPRPEVEDETPPPLLSIMEDDVLELAIVELPPDFESVAAVPPEVTPRPAPRAAPSAASSAPSPSSPAIVATTAAALPPALPEAALPEPAPSPRSALSMRNALPTRLVVPDLRKIAESGPAAVATRAPMSEELEAAGGGTYRAESSGFTAKINRDGTVKISDKRNLNVNVALPSPKAIGRGLAEWYKDPYAQTRDREREAEQGRVPSGAVDDEEEQRKRPKTVPLVSGSFDVTDWLMRLSGRDPYFAAKLSLLNRTREVRAQLATEHRTELLRQVVTMVREQAALVWNDATQPAAARRRALFELWDDCAETGEAEVVRAGKRARVALYGFIRAHANTAGPDAYSAEELAELNRGRRSKQRFAPYPAPDAAAYPEPGTAAAPADAEDPSLEPATD